MMTAWYFSAGGRSERSRMARSPSSTQEGADGLGHVGAVVDAGRHQHVLVRERRVQVLLELARAVGALHLPVAELVHARQDLVAQHGDAQLRVPRRQLSPSE